MRTWYVEQKFHGEARSKNWQSGTFQTTLSVRVIGTHVMFSCMLAKKAQKYKKADSLAIRLIIQLIGPQTCTSTKHESFDGKLVAKIRKTLQLKYIFSWQQQYRTYIHTRALCQFAVPSWMSTHCRGATRGWCWFGPVSKQSPIKANRQTINTHTHTHSQFHRNPNHGVDMSHNSATSHRYVHASAIATLGVETTPLCTSRNVKIATYDFTLR